MKYTKKGERVTLEMTQEDFASLLIAVGYRAGGVAREHDPKTFWRWIQFANDLNTGNPNFTPYEIPPEFARPKARATAEVGSTKKSLKKP